MTPISRRRALGAAAAPAFIQSKTAPPNLLLILSDDHSVPYLGAYGAKYMSTPNLDRFASEAIRFDKAFTVAPQCVPSRAAYLTGRSPVAVRMGRFSAPMPPEIVSLPEMLKERGYATGVCGRYFHLNGVIKSSEATRATYDKYGLQTWQRRVDYMDVSPQQGTAAKFDQFLQAQGKGKPFFFWINYSDPHHVWDKDAGRVDPGKIQLPPHLPDLPGVRGDLARYCGEVERMDGFFQQAMDVLKKHGIEENTLVVFAGDNGMAFPHGKGSLYDPGLNVPAMARWPGRIKGGSSTRSMISGEDLTPTFLDAAGMKPLGEMTGRSWLPLATGGAYEPRRHIFGQRLPHGNAPFTPQTRAANFDLSRCVRSDRWKLIYNCTPQMEYWPVDSAADPGWQEMLAAHREGRLKPEHERAYFQRPRSVMELFDLDADPGELNNLAGRPETASVERELALALHERMIVDFDFLPPPFAN
ncbi:MAG: sulfatase [Acidobacteria bacterium]|nr:sulfatase [Acidobacteriota bacterium]